MAGIVTIPGGVTGPALQVTQLINAKWGNAQGWFERAFEFGESIKGEVGTAAQLPMPAINSSIQKINAPGNLKFDDARSAQSAFDSINNELGELVEETFKKIMDEAFPDKELFGQVTAWCGKAIVDGGTGISTDVEAALWERARSRILRQADRDMMSAQEKYARAGWPLPPGAMLNDISMIRQDSRDKLAEQGRDIAVKSFEAEIENVRFAIKTVTDLHRQAFQAASDYVRAVMLAPQAATQLTQTLSGLQNDASRTLVALYQAQSAALEPFLRMEITDAELKQRAGEANLRATTETAQLRANAALANLRMVGDAAAASLNGIGASVSNSISQSV